MDRDIEIAPFDNLLVYKKDFTSEYCRKTILEKKLGGLRIFSVLKDDRLESIDFLSEYSFLDKLDITSSVDFDFRVLNKLENLSKLSINVGGTNEINLSSLKKLEHLSVNWRQRINGLENCLNLSTLFISEFKEKDLSKVSILKNLLSINIKTASIESLGGLENLKKLESLNLSNCKKLLSINLINRLPKIRNVLFDTCPNIRDYSLLTLPNLSSLSLIDCGKIDSLDFINRFPSLQSLSLLGNTMIKDGNLIPAKNIKLIKYEHYDHYNINLKNSINIENNKNSINIIKKLFE